VVMKNRISYFLRLLPLRLLGQPAAGFDAAK